MIRKFLLIISILSLVTAKAQQLPIDNQYIINKFAISPAYAGFNGNAETFIGFRKNWAGIPGAPKKQFISLNMPIQTENAGLGLSVVSEETGNFEYFSALFSYAYHIEISKDAYLSLALGAEAYRNQLDLSNIKTIQGQTGQDPYLMNSESLRGTTFDATIATMFYANKITCGIVVPRAIGMKINYDKETKENKYTLSRHYIAHASYKFEANKEMVIEPSVIVRTTQNTPFFFETSVIAIYNKKLWGGFIYRKGNSIGTTIGGSLAHNFVMNYSYEFGINSILGLSSGTHEISVGYMLKYGKRGNEYTAFRDKPKVAGKDKRVDNLKKEFTAYKTKTDKKIKQLEERMDKIGDKMADEALDEYGKPYVLKNIKFGINSDKLFSSSFSALDKLVRKLSNNKKIHILITGHTDNVGSPRYNLRLSKKRADAVKKYLVGKGIADARIKTEGMGDKKPTASNETRDGRAKNRRIEAREKIVN